MKKLARINNDPSSAIITADEAIKLRATNPEEFEGRTYYSIISLHPMHPVDGESKYFAFNSGYGGGHKNGGMGITHELVQYNLCSLDTYTFRVYGQEIILDISNAFTEWYIQDPDNPNRTAYIDCCLELAPGTESYERFGPKIGFEITDTHKTTYRKQNLLKDLNIFVFEIVTIKDWHIRNDEPPTTTEIEKLLRRIKGYLNSIQNVSILSRPSYI